MLRCMCLKTSYLPDLPLPTAAAYLIRKPDGRFLLDSNRIAAEETLARVDLQHPLLLVDTFADVNLEPAPSTTPTPASSTSPSGHFQLQNDDCLHFPKQDVKVLYTAWAPPPSIDTVPLPSPSMAETRDPPRVSEDAETEDEDDSLDPQPAPEVTETPVASRQAEHEETPISAAKMRPSQDEIADAEVLSSPARARRTYSHRNRTKNVKVSDAAATAPDSPDETSESVSVMGEDQAVEDKITSSSGKLPLPKKGAKRKVAPRPRGADETYNVSVEDEEERPAKRRRLPEVARDESPADEIVVAPPSSKKQVPQRSSKRKSATPASNASLVSTPSLLASRPPKALLTQCKLDSKTSSWIKKKITVVDEVPTPRINYMCITRHKDLPTTAKVLKALVAGKPVFSVQWITDSHKQGQLLDLDSYKHPEVQDNGDKNRRHNLFSGKTLFFTSPAVNAYGEYWGAIQEVAKDAGAMAVEEGLAASGDKLTPKHNVILFGNGDDDGIACRLITDYARVVYDKTMLAKSIVRAQLDVDSDEFKLKGGSPADGGNQKKTRGRTD